MERSTLIRVLTLKSATAVELKIIMDTIFKNDHHGLHHNKVLDMLNTRNVHIMLVDIDALAEKSLKALGYKPKPQPRLVIS